MDYPISSPCPWRYRMSADMADGMAKENTLTVHLTVAEVRAILHVLGYGDDAILERRQRLSLAGGIGKLNEKVRAWERRRLETGINA